MAYTEIGTAAMLYQLPEAFVITNTNGDVVFFNQAAETLTGYTSEFILGRNVSLLMPESDRTQLDVVAWFSRWADSPDQNKQRFVNLEGVTQSGKKLLYRVKVARIQDPAGTSYFLLLVRDVTAEYLELKASRHAKMLAERIIAIGDNGVLTVDRKQQILMFNRRAEEIFGYTAGEVLGNSIDLLLPEMARANHSRQILSFSEGTIPTRLMGERGEVLGRHKSGMEIPLEIAITKTQIEGELILSAQIRDITSRKALEAKWHDNEKRYRGIFEGSIEAMALLTPGGEVLEMNESANSLLPDTDLPVGSLFWNLNWWHSDDVDALTASRSNLRQLVEEASSGILVRRRLTLEGARPSTEIDFSLNPVTADTREVIYIIAEGRPLSARTQ